VLEENELQEILSLFYNTVKMLHIIPDSSYLSVSLWSTTKHDWESNLAVYI